MAVRLAAPRALRLLAAGAMVVAGASVGMLTSGLESASATAPSAGSAVATSAAAATTAAVPATPALAKTPHATPLATGTYCQGAQPTEPSSGPTKVMLIELENESSTSISSSPDAPFENGTLTSQCGNFATTAMHSTTHPSESNYFAEVSGLNAAINSGNDALARFGLSDCPPDSTSTACAYGGGHFASTVPSLFSQIEQQYGTNGWKTYADDMPSACDKADGNVYVKTATTTYPKYVTRHNPAVFFNGIACGSQDVPSGAWQAQQGQLYTDLTTGNLPEFSFVEPNDIENGHDPVSVNGVTVAGGVSQVGNIDSYLSSFMPLVQASPDYQSGNLVVMITFDEGTKAGPIVGEDTVGENCADPTISVLATSCQVQTWIVGRYVPSFTYPSYMNQFGLLSATERILGLSPLLGHASDSSVPDIVNGTPPIQNPFNLAPTAGQTVPSAPTITNVTAADSSATVSFTPAFNGGSPISSYQVTANPGGNTASGTASPITVTGLSNGTSYTFTVTATNGIGASAPSAPSNAVTPAAATPPGSPSGLTATSGNGLVGLAWTAPAVTGGAPITDYAIQYRLTGTSTWTAAPDPHSSSTNGTVSGLVNGSGYDFEVSAVNSAGPGSPSTIATATPTAAGPELLPDPGFEQGAGGWKAFTVGTFSQVTTPVHGGSKALQIAAVGSTATLVGMTQNTVVSNSVAGTNYTAQCYVQPTSANLNVQIRFLEYTQNLSTDIHLGTTTINSLPTGVWTLVSVSSAAVNSGERMIPQIYSTNETTSTGSIVYDDCSVRAGSQPPVLTAPSAPTSVSATATDGAASVSFAAPASTGGAPITGYTVTATPGGATAVGTASPIQIAGLTDGISYTFAVTATNSAGTGPVSSSSPPVTPAGPPGTPAAPTVTPLDGQVAVSWSAPSANGSPITDYVVQSRPTGTDGWVTSADGVSPATTATVSGLTDGTSYDFQVAAVNAIGQGSFSAINTATPMASPITLPGPPTAVSAVAADGSASVSFAAPASNGGAPISSYTVTSSPGGITASGASSPITVAGLTDGTAYTFTVTASNSAGAGTASNPSASVTPTAELLPDPGFELGNGGWAAFTVGVLTRVSSPVHGGLSALQVSATGPTSGTLVGLTQNTVIKQSVAGTTYSAQCYVEPTGANVNVQIRFLEYNQALTSDVHLQTTTIPKLTAGVWTLVKVSSVAVNSGERLIPQIYSTNETTTTGNLIYDDCSVHVGS